MRSLFVLRVYARVHVRALSFSYVTFGVASHLISSLLFSSLLGVRSGYTSFISINFHFYKL